MLDLHLPPLERIYAPPSWLHLGAKLKHVIEADAEYEYVTGVNEFEKIIHFDSTDIISNTNQLTVALTNRLYKKTKKGDVSEFLTWRVSQARYFDPTFGRHGGRSENGELRGGQLTPYTFLDGPRGYSPVISSLTVNPYSFSPWNTAPPTIHGGINCGSHDLWIGPGLEIFRFSRRHRHHHESAPGPTSESNFVLRRIRQYESQRLECGRRRYTGSTASENALPVCASLLQHRLLRLQRAIAALQYWYSGRKPVFVLLLGGESRNVR